MRKSQTATEYLVILAVVIVISLVVVASLGGFPGIGSSSNKKVTDLKLASDIIGVDSYAFGTSNSTFNLKNNNYETVVINEFRLNQQENLTCNSLNTVPQLPIVLNIGESKLITCSAIKSSDYIISNKQTPVIGILYTDQMGTVRVAGNVNLYDNVQRDLVSPYLNISFPLNSQLYSNYSNNSYINYSASDEFGINHVSICDDNICYNDSACQNQTTCSAIYSGLNSSVGNHIWNVTVYDLSGNYDAKIISFTIYVPDLSSPSVSILYPLNTVSYSNLLNLTYMNISVIDDFNISHFVICDNTSCYNDSSCQNMPSCILHFTGLNYSIGNNTWNITVFDTSNNSNTSTTHFSVYVPDLTSPSVSISYPVVGGNYTSVATLNYTVSDNIGVSYVRVCDSVGCYNDYTCQNQLSCSASYAGLNYSLGSNIWNITVFDTSNNFNTTSKTFNIISAGFSCTSQNAQGFYNGTGTSADPYGICNCTMLQNIQNYLTSNYTLLSNIDCSDTINWNGGKGFNPLGCGPTNCGTRSVNVGFSGYLNGTNHTITGLYINRPVEDYVGLVGDATGSGGIRYLGLESPRVFGHDYIGIFQGRGYGLKYSIYVNNGVISGNTAVGGLVGWNMGMIYFSYGYVNVTGSSYVGGLAGDIAMSGNTVYSYFVGNVTGTSLTGGLVGQSNGGSIQHSFSIAKVTAGATVGGLFGNKATSTIVNSYWYDTAGDSATVCYNGGNTGCTLINDGNGGLAYFKGNVYPSKQPFGNWSFFSDFSFEERENDYPSLKWQHLGTNIP